MKFNKILQKHLGISLSEVQDRVVAGHSFEKWFGETYRVEVADKVYRKSNIEVRFANPKSKAPKDIFPSIKMLQDLNIEDIHLESKKGTAFLLFKADFKNFEKNIFNLLKNKYIEINGENENFFELKKSSPNFSRKIMFSEFKKIATRKQFVEAFGSENTVNSWNSLSEEEKRKQWKSFLSQISKEAEEKINHHNEMITYIQNTLNEIKPLVQANIARRLKNLLHNKGWFLVKGVMGRISFHRINVDKFIENISLQTTKWSGIKRIKLDILPETIDYKIDDNHIKNNIINLVEEENNMTSLSFKISVELDGEMNVDFAKEISSRLVARDDTETKEPQQMPLASSTILNTKKMLKD